ncbi:MAG: outer membrane lipoprotein LolB [Lysobacteraceae bacterium]|nr:MAG: outer membrane lipoprotein LolB [Xanthomonadaceae bacterium]
MNMPARCLLALGALVLGACAGPRIRVQVDDATAMQRLQAREQALAGVQAWTLRGRLGVSDGRDGGSGTLEWNQRGEVFRFSVHAPVTGKTWILAGTPSHAVLSGLRPAPIEGRDARELLARELDWDVPVAQLVDWVRGRRAPGEARVEFRADGLPAAISQDGWRVEFLDYDDSSPPLPRRLHASSGSRTVRLAIRAWSVE